ncbi:photo-regulated tyrosinase [Amylocystis lapponica]|nr:photo-regulated tyrosinase [Amylocystis lapponica]
MSHFVTTGAQGGHTEAALAPNRREIHDLVKDVKQFSLYVQATAEMTSTSQQDVISWFSIASIHGLPHVQWNGAGSDKPVSTQWGGYCTHGSVLFPTWHRPYVALFEQVLQQHAINIAKKYTTESSAWNLAALNLRAPYWDWAYQVVPPPEVISLEKVKIITPTSHGQMVSVDNPLIRYIFKPIEPSFPSPASAWPTTLRYPTSAAVDATSDVTKLIEALNSSGPGLRKSIYNLMTRVNTWEAFSNHTPGNGGSATASLEGIHDSIHVDAGGLVNSNGVSHNGHMSNPAIAGFDPIFFMHHANVDRMLSLWAAINPTVWVVDGPANNGTWTISEKSTVGATTELGPFFSSQTGYWKSTEVAQTHPLGYSYPEFNGLNMGDKDAVRIAISRKVNELYGSGGLSVPGGPAPTPAPAPVPTPSGEILEWSAQVHFKKFELQKSFSVLLFLGPVPENTADWRTSPSFAGATHAFANSAAENCENCRAHSDMVVEGFVHLNDSLLKHPHLRSLESAAVVPHLQRELSWRLFTGVDVPLENLPSLEVTVMATPVTQGPGDIFPVAGTPRLFHHVTHGRQGGCRVAA